MNFEFATAHRIIFGRGVASAVGEHASPFGRHALLVTGRSRDRAHMISQKLEQAGLKVTFFSVDGEPTTDNVALGVELARKQDCDLVIGMGGGSALDAGKAIAALVPNPGEILDYLEVIGKGLQLINKPLPYLAIPTTAGTGTEVTRNAVLGSIKHGVKVSLRSHQMLPRLAIIDPELTLSLPSGITASTGLDALTQLVEPFVTPGASPLTDAVCREGISRAARSLRRAAEHGEDMQAREDMSLAALFGGMALANARLGAVHGFAGPLGGMFSAPHGAICGLLLAEVMQENIEALQISREGAYALTRYAEIAKILTGDDIAATQDGVTWVRKLCTDLRLPRLSAYGIEQGHFSEIIDKSSRASSMKGNPIALTPVQMERILWRAL